MLRTIKRQAGGTATKKDFKLNTEGVPLVTVNGKKVSLSPNEYRKLLPTLATVSKKDPELYIKPPLKEIEVVATKPSWMKNREEAEKLPEYSFDKFKENVLPNWAGALGVTKDTMSDETKQQRQDWIDKYYVAPKLFAENKGYYDYTDKEREILDKSNLPDWLKKKEQDITNTSNKLQKEKGVIGSLRTPEDMAKVANATQFRFNTGNKVIDTVNPLTGLAGMATNLGNARLDIKKGNTGKAFASIITPVIAGAAFNLAGKQSNAQFVADNLSPIPVNADKVVQSVRNYTKSIPKPLLKSTGYRKLVDQASKSELRLPRLQQTSNTDLNIPTTEELRTMIQNRESSLNRNPLPNSGTDYPQLRNTPATQLAAERYRIPIQEIDPNLYVHQSNIKPNINNNSVSTKKPAFVPTNETDEHFLKITKSLQDNYPDKNIRFDVDVPSKTIEIYHTVDGVEKKNGYMDFSVGRSKKTGKFHWTRENDFPNKEAEKEVEGKYLKKGLSYNMSKLLNENIKQNNGILSSSDYHLDAGLRRYFKNAINDDVYMLPPKNMKEDRELFDEYNRHINELKAKLKLENRKVTDKDIDNIFKDDSYFHLFSKTQQYRYYKIGGKKYKYFL